MRGVKDIFSIFGTNSTRMKNILLFFVVCYFLIPSFLKAQNHLEPDRGIYTEHTSRIKELDERKNILLHNFSYRPIVRIIVKPTFENPYVLSLEKDEYYCHILIYQRPYREKKKLKYKRVQREISLEDAQLIELLINTALKTTRYPENNDVIYIDGTRYYFIGNYFRSGNLHSATEGEDMIELISIVDELTQIAIRSASLDEQDEIELDESFSNRIKKLIEKLNNL